MDMTAEFQKEFQKDSGFDTFYKLVTIIQEPRDVIIGSVVLHAQCWVDASAELEVNPLRIRSYVIFLDHTV